MHVLYNYRIFLPVLILIFLISSNCTNEIKQTNSPEIESVSYLALGDSYTIGTGIQEEDNWPNQLSEALTESDLTVEKTEVIAVNGWTTTDLKNGIVETDPDSSFDLVSLLIGVNNQYQGLDIELYRTEFRELLERSVAFAQGDTSRVFVVSIPNYGVTPFGQSRNPVIIRQELQIYNDIAKNISSEYDIPFVDITPISELAAEDPSLIAPDNLHPSAKMYTLWVEEMLPTVTQILQNHERI